MKKSWLRIYIYFFLASIIFIVDRLTKLAALMYAKTPQVMNKYLSFELVFNRGVSWGMFHDASHYGFVFVSAMIALITLFLCWHAYDAYKKGNYVIGHVCIIAGSVSNLLDRVIYGGVIDFVLFSYHQYSWPLFNIADVAIVCGVGLLIVLDEYA